MISSNVIDRLSESNKTICFFKMIYVWFEHILMQKDSEQVLKYLERLLLAWLLSFEKRLAIVEVMF